MPDIRINLSKEENKAAIKMATALGMSKRKYVKQLLRHGLIRKGLVKQNADDIEAGLTRKDESCEPEEDASREDCHTCKHSGAGEDLACEDCSVLQLKDFSNWEPKA